MSYTQPLNLTKSVLDVKIIYSNSLLATPIDLTQGNGKANILSINISDSVIYDRTANGDVSLAQIPEIVTGSVMTHPNSQVMNYLAQMTTRFANQFILTPGQITISSVTGGFSYTLNNVVFTKRLGGLGIADVIEDYEFEFKCTPPENYLSLANGGNTLGAFINLVGF
jgi:hypothetical protein